MAHDPKLVEAVARALCAVDVLDGCDPWEAHSSHAEWTERATAALDAITAAGCVVVPVEPTHGMAAAADVARYCIERAASPPTAVETYQAIYRAMLAARPGAQPSPLAGLRTRMVVCPTCGNKRCPHKANRALACTGSNEPGQPGSDYP